MIKMNSQEESNEKLVTELNELKKEIESLRNIHENELYIHKQTDLELRKSEERLRYALEVATDGLWDWDVLSNRVFYSMQWKAMLGFEDSEIGETLEEWSNRIHPDDLDMVLKTVDQYINGEIDTYAFEHRLICKDGSYKWINDEGKIVTRDDHGKPLRLIGTHKDITQRKQAEKDLRESEAKYRDLIGNINDVIYATDIHANITFISPSIQKLLGYLPEEIIGKNFSFFVGDKHEQLQQRFNEIERTFELINEYQIQSKTGEQHWVRFSSKALFNEKQFSGVTGTLTDITETKLIELELQKSESLYRSILHASPDTIFISDLEGHVLFTSPMALKMFGYEEIEFPLNTPLFDFVDPKDHSKARDAIAQMFEGKYFGSTEYMGIKSDGSKFDMEVNGEFIRDVEGHPTSIVFVVRDVSERKLANEKLHKSEDNYQKLVESISDIVFEVTIDGIIKYISPSIEKSFNYKPEDLIGQNFFSFVYPEDLSFLLDVFQNNRFNEYKNIEYRCLTESGKIIWVQVSAKSIYEEGVLVGRSGILHDITDKKHAEEKLRKSEEQYRRVVESINDVIFEIDIEGNIKFISQSIFKVLGITVEEIIGRNIYEYIHPEDSPGILNRLKNSPVNNINYMEYRLIRKDGSIHWVRSSTSVIIENGERIGGAGILTDITDRKLAEETLKDKTNLLTNLIINLQEGILLEDSTRKIALTNQLFCDMFGIPVPPEALIGADCSTSAEESKIFFKNPEKFIVDIERILEDKKAVYCDELELVDGRYLERDYIPTYIENKYNGHLWKYRDITERKLAEEKVKDSEAKFRMVFENVFDGISIFEEASDPENRKLVDCNEQYAAMAGRSREELLDIGNTYSLTKTITDHANEMRLHNILDNQAYQGSFKWLRPDGKDNTIEYIGRPITWNGKSYSIGIDRDITETKQKEDQLRKLSQAVEQSPVSIVITDLDGNIEYANPIACETTGYRLEELKGNNPRVLKSGETPIDEYKYLWDSISCGNVWKGIFHNKRKNGELYWESSQITAITDENGNITNYLALKEDITQRKKIREELAKSEDRFREITEQSQNVIWETDSEAVYTFVSQASEIAWGLKPSDLVGKKRFFDIHPEEGRKEFIDACLRQIHKGAQFRNMESLIQGEDGKMNWVMTNGMPYLDSEGNVKGYRGSSLNINQQKSAFEELRQSEERYKSIFRNNHSVMMIVDPETGNIKDVNTSACNYYQWTYDEMCSKNITEVNVLTRKEINEEMQKAKEEKRTQFFFKHRLSNGEIRDVEVYSCPLKFGDSTLLYSIVHDISERRLAEEALLQREQDLNFSQEIAGMGSWKLNMVTNTSKWSDNLYRIFDLDPDKEKASQDLFFELIHPDDRHLISDYMEKIFRDRKQVTFEMRMNQKSGKTIWIQNSMIPDFEGDQLVTLNGTNVDITYKKLAEEALKINEAALNQAQEISMMCSWELDLETENLIWSKNYYHLMGIPFGAKMETDFFIERVHPDDIHLVNENLEAMKLSKKPVSYDIRLRMPDNEYRWIENNIVPEFESEKLVRLKGVNIDVTEKKLAEENIRQQNERLSAIINAIPDLIFVSDREGAYLEFYNAGNQNLLYSADQVVGSTVRDLFDVETSDLHIRKIDECLQTQKLVTYEYSAEINGIYKYCEARLAPLGNDKVLRFIRDFTQEKQKDTEIRKLSLAVEQSPTIIVITDLNGNIEYVNPAFEAITGYQNEEVLGKNTRILKSGKTDSKTYSNLWDTLNAGDEWYGEWQNKKKNGELYWEYVSITPIRNENGKITNYLAVKQDISQRKHTEQEIQDLNANLEVKIEERTAQLAKTNVTLLEEIEERKRIENALSESEKSYRTVVENVNEVIFQTDAEGLWVFLNKSWEHITGFSVNESLGQLFVDYVHPDDRARNWELFEPLILRKKEYCRHEIRYLTKGGGFRWIEVFARLGLNDKDEITGTFGTLMDITERRLAEAALRDSEIRYTSMIANISDVIGIIGADGVMSYKSPNITRYFGWQPEDLVGTNGWLTVHPDDLDRIQKEFYTVVQKDNAATTVEYSYLCKDGSYKPIELTATNLINNKIINGVLLNYHDITARKLAEEELSQMSSRLNLALRVGGIGVWDYDVVNNVLLWDNQMFAIYGIRKEDFSSAYDAWLKGLHPDDKKRGDKEIQMAILGEKEFDTEFRVVWPDGSVHFVRALAAVERDHSGQALRVIGTNWDITIQKQAANFENEILQLSTKLTGVTISEIDSALKLALLRIGQFLNADRAYIFEFNDPDECMNNTYEWCNEGIQPEIGNMQELSYNLIPNWMGTLRSHQNIIISSVQDLPESWQSEREILETQGIQSLVVIPLLVENNLIGFVGLDSVKAKRDYNSTEMNMLKVWSSMLSSLIQNKRVEGLLEQTRQNYETFFNTIDDFLWVLDQQGNIIHTNKTVTNRLEYTTEELLDSSILLVHPAERREEAGRIVGEMLAGTSEFCPVPVVTKSGKTIPVETKVKPGFWNGKEVIFGVSKDISQIKISEEKFSKAFQSNSAMMAISYIDSGKFIDVNNAFLETLEFTRDEIIGKTSLDFELYADQNDRDIIRNFDQNSPIRKMEVLLLTKSGHIKTGLISADYIYIGETRCLLTVTVDITDRKKVEEEIKAARMEADNANLAKSEFLSRMSHELRTPMNSILGFAQLLEMGELTTGQKKGTNHILKSGRHLLDLINEVLDISRIEAGRMSLSIEPVQLNGVIAEMTDIVRLSADERLIKIELTNSSFSYLFVKSDRQRLKQVLLNLLSNAVKYNRKNGTVLINCELRPINESGIAMVRISVTDTGWGISKEDLPKLFKPFERIGAEKTVTEGTGLGLSVVKKLVEAMGGTVGVESQYGIGSTFWIELPGSESQLESAIKSGIFENPKIQLPNKAGTILYIEDNISNIELVEQILSIQRSDLRLITHMSGKQAVQLAIDYRPVLILLDLDLPDIHGSEVLYRLLSHEQTRNIPVVIISADAMPQQISRLLKAGAKDYLTKPLDLTLFLRIIDDIIIAQDIKGTLN